MHQCVPGTLSSCWLRSEVIPSVYTVWNDFMRLHIDAFIKVWWNFDKMQIIFKAITGGSSHAFWWERTVLHSMEMLFDAGLVALEIISPGKGIYYGTLRCRKLPSKENFPRQWPVPWFLRQIFHSPAQCCTFFPTNGHDWNFRLSLWIWFASYQNSITPWSWKHLLMNQTDCLTHRLSGTTVRMVCQNGLRI